MNTTVKTFATMGALCAFTGFTTAPSVPIEIERSYYVPKEFFARKETPTALECWSKFLESLRKLDAIVYIPEDKRAMAEQLGLHFTDPAGSDRINENVTINFAKLSPVEPLVGPSDDKCGQVNLKTFRSLGMIALVQKSRFASLNTYPVKWSDIVLKIEGSHKDGRIKNEGALKQDQNIKVELGADLQHKNPTNNGKWSPGTLGILIGLNQGEGMAKNFVPASSFDIFSK